MSAASTIGKVKTRFLPTITSWAPFWAGRGQQKTRSVAGLKEGTITVDVVNELVEARGDGRLEVE
jgi:hypothetical protein